MARRKVYSFTQRRYSANAICSFVLALISVLAFLVLLLLSFSLKGTAGSWIGALGFTGIVFGILGLRYGLVSFRDDCNSYFMSKLGAIFSTVAIVIWFFVVCVGLT